MAPINPVASLAEQSEPFDPGAMTLPAFSVVHRTLSEAGTPEQRWISAGPVLLLRTPPQALPLQAGGLLLGGPMG